VVWVAGALLADGNFVVSGSSGLRLQWQGWLLL
jgi:hypothetical protein